ncbi:CLUMA_CG018639, isoform A [Clunio marinus]|uniref:CLUMA_CG018639, isoform A n=1 Tax=Clunio marinus TaxID=568069 RepID=A0A1J1IZ35_9DIPT|nr:CLUMA_CG018639, isoform A [Clunio marinus]
MLEHNVASMSIMEAFSYKIMKDEVKKSLDEFELSQKSSFFMSKRLKVFPFRILARTVIQTVIKM